MSTLIKICFKLIILVLTLTVFCTVSTPEVQACSVAPFYFKFPQDNATNIPLNTGIDFVSFGNHFDSDHFTVTLEDDNGNIVDGVLSDTNDYGPLGSIFNSHSIIFQPTVILSPNTTYTVTYEEDWSTPLTRTFTTGNSEDITAPQISDLGIDSVEFDYGDIYNSCDRGQQNVIHLNRTDDSVSDEDSSDVFLRFYIAETLTDIDWDRPTAAGFDGMSRVNFNVITAGDYVMAVNAMDSAGNVSCTYYAEFQTLDGSGADTVQIDADFILLEDCGGELAGSVIATNGTTTVGNPGNWPTTGGGQATSSSSGCQLNVASASGSSNLMFYCMIVLFTMICLIRRKGYTIKN